MGRKLRGRLERSVDFPVGSLSAGTLMEVESNRRVVVEGCRGILSYTEDCIRLRVPEGELSFMGCGLAMSCLSPEGATVTGVIQSIAFAGGDL